MPTLQDVAGDTGVFTDGNWILSENMDANGKYGVIQLKHVGIGEFLGYKDFNFINEKTFNDLRCTEVLPGDVLISRMADPIGRACIVPRLPFPCVTAVDVTIVRIDKNIAESEFIMHLCNSPSMREKIDRAVRGTTRARITRTELGELEIPLPPLTEQKRIASLLARADRLRQLRRTAHDLGDALLQSVFLEMFGDPVRNEKGWEEKNLNELCRNITDGTHDTPDRTDSGVPFITSKNIRPYEIDLSVLEYVSEETHQEIIKRTNPHYGDVIYTNIGANLGNAAMNKLPFSFSLKNVALLQPDVEQLNSYYLEALLNNERFKDNLIYLSSAGGAQKFITLEVLRCISIPYPPISIQEKFATILESYQRMRAQQVESERQVETLFQDLLSQAFQIHV